MLHAKWKGAAIVHDQGRPPCICSQYVGELAIGVNGWKIIGLLRLSPLIPFNFSNYFYGITSVSLRAYVAISAIGMLPGTLLYAYLGAIGKAGVTSGASPRSNWQYVFLGIGLAATIAVTILVSRIAKNALKKSGADKFGAGKLVK